MTVQLGSLPGAQALDPFCGSGGFAMENLVKLIQAIGGLEPRVAALAVVALALVVVALIATR